MTVRRLLQPLAPLVVIASGCAASPPQAPEPAPTERRSTATAQPVTQEIPGRASAARPNQVSSQPREASEPTVFEAIPSPDRLPIRSDRPQSGIQVQQENKNVAVQPVARQARSPRSQSASGWTVTYSTGGRRQAEEYERRGLADLRLGEQGQDPCPQFSNAASEYRNAYADGDQAAAADLKRVNGYLDSFGCNRRTWRDRFR